MEECVFVVSYVDESGIKTGHQFFDFSQIYVAYSIGNVACLFLERHEPGVFEKFYLLFLGLYFDYKFALHWLRLIKINVLKNTKNKL